MLGIGPIRWPLALSRPALEGIRLEVYASMGAWLAPSEYRVFLFSERPHTRQHAGCSYVASYNPMWSIGATRWWNLLSGWHRIVRGISRIMPLEQAHLTATMWHRVHVWHRIREELRIGVGIWWPATRYGAPGTVISGLQRRQSSMVNAKTPIYTSSGRLDSVTPYV
jgi:hypothetical protein